MKLLVISGGTHPYEESTPILEEFLKGAGHDITLTEDASILADSGQMSGFDALCLARPPALDRTEVGSGGRSSRRRAA